MRIKIHNIFVLRYEIIQSYFNVKIWPGITVSKNGKEKEGLNYSVIYYCHPFFAFDPGIPPPLLPPPLLFIYLFNNSRLPLVLLCKVIPKNPKEEGITHLR